MSSKKAISSLVKYFLISTLILLIYFSLSTKVAHAKSDDFMFNNLILAGNLYLQSGSYEDALGKFLKAQELEKGNPDVLIGLIRSYSRLNDFETANEKLMYYKKHFSRDQRVHLVTGEYLALKGHNEEAAEEFTKLVKGGIYRYEALQGLIRLYAESDDPELLIIIEETIPLYEPENQAVLYELLSDCLREKGKIVPAQKYEKHHNAMVGDDSNSGLPEGVVQISPLDQVVVEVENLMAMGEFGAAEFILSDASRRWPGNRQIQDLLKACYMNIVEDVPITANNETSGSGGINSMFPLESSISGGIMTSIPPDGNYSAEVEIYITTVLNITGKTEDYFEKMMCNFSALRSRISDESSGTGNARNNLKQNVDELRVLLSESSAVCSKEIDALNDLTPPENFVEFHEYLIDITQDLGDAFLLIDKFVVYADWSSYYKVMSSLATIDKRKEILINLFETAISKETLNSQPVYSEELLY